MKARIFQKCGLALMLGLAPFFGGCDQEQANSAPVTTQTVEVTTSQPPASAAPETLDTNQPAPVETDEELADAPGKIISTPDTASTNTSNNPQINDMVKLVEAGMGESVLMAYVTNSPTAFGLSSDDILYLNDIGTPETVVTAMLQRDQALTGKVASVTPSTLPMTAQTQPGYAYANPAPVAPESYPDQNAMAQATDNVGVPPLTPPTDVEADVEAAPNASYSYFYDSLAPYGNWVDIEGYGPCWRPTVVAANPNWQPYCDRGHWDYTDCGWCWVSDYSWGWAPFHYGRWFRNNHWGWCWAPDTVWGPSWVSWRYSDSYCGWAPLPPTACYRPGFGFTYFGRSVGFNFGFGIGADRFVFVSLDHFHDRTLGRYRLPHREVTRIYNTTTINNRIIRGNNHTLINPGVPVERVAAASHTEIRPIHLRADTDAPRSAQLGRDGRSLSVYRPALPTPRTAVAPRLAGEGVQRDTHFDLHSHVERMPATRNPVVAPAPERRPIIPNAAVVRPSENAGRENRFSQPNVEKSGALILRGPDRTERGIPNRNDNPGQMPPSNLRHGPVFQPQMPAQPAVPADNNRRTFVPPGQQPDRSGSPLQNPRDNDLRRNEADGQRQQRELQQQQQQQQQQRDFQPQPGFPRQDPQPRSFEAPRNNNNNFNSGYRSEPAAPPRAIESRPPPEVRSAPPQYSAPAHESRQDNNNNQSGGGGNRGGGGGGNGNSDGGGNGRGNR